jgi:ectoine hydroxylase-related dioxygenase (phytanoyl-CoA dioxygenase family)
MTITAEQTDAYKRDGMVILRGFFEPARIEALALEYQHAFDRAPEGQAPGERPVAVFWTHVEGGRKRLAPLDELPVLSDIALGRRVSGVIKALAQSGPIRLLESVIFNKPPGRGRVLRWHQDVSYFPLEPNNQIAVWIPFDVVRRENGAVLYALGSHRSPIMGSVNLHTGQPFGGDARQTIPDDPSKLGFTVVPAEVDPGDMIVHDGRVWHMSGDNATAGMPRRAMTLRYLCGRTIYRPHAGNAATFLAQVKVKPGEELAGTAFPRVL